MRLDPRRLTKKEVLLAVASVIVISIVGFRYAETAVPDFVTEYSYSIKILDSASGLGNFSVLFKVSNVGFADGYPSLHISVSVSRGRGFNYDFPLGFLPKGGHLEYEWDEQFVAIDPEYAGISAYVPDT